MTEKTASEDCVRALFWRTRDRLDLEVSLRPSLDACAMRRRANPRFSAMRVRDPVTDEVLVVCDRCDQDPIVFVYSPAGAIELCLEHVKPSIPSVEWWEERHMPLADHLGDALERAIEAQKAAGPKALATVGARKDGDG